MKKHRKQRIFANGKMLLVDVPVDDVLYTMDNREEYLRVRSINKHVSLETFIIENIAPDVAEAYEKAQLIEKLRAALLILSDKERLIIELYYFDGLTERQIGEKINMKHQNVHRKKKEIIGKLRGILVDWL